MDTCPRCGSGMLPWRHSDAWWAFTCWACHFVAFEKVQEREPDSERASEGAGDDLQAVRQRDAPLVSALRLQVVRVPELRVRGDRAGGRAAGERSTGVSIA